MNTTIKNKFTWNEAVKQLQKEGWLWMGTNGTHFIFERNELRILVKPE